MNKKVASLCVYFFTFQSLWLVFIISQRVNIGFVFEILLAIPFSFFPFVILRNSLISSVNSEPDSPG